MAPPLARRLGRLVQQRFHSSQPGSVPDRAEELGRAAEGRPGGGIPHGREAASLAEQCFSLFRYVTELSPALCRGGVHDRRRRLVPVGFCERRLSCSKGVCVKPPASAVRTISGSRIA